MTAQGNCHTTKEIATSLPVNLERVYKQKTISHLKAASTGTKKASKPTYSAPSISWEYFQNELEFE